jgi:hypothetical protein
MANILDIQIWMVHRIRGVIVSFRLPSASPPRVASSTDLIEYRYRG